MKRMKIITRIGVGMIALLSACSAGEPPVENAAIMEQTEVSKIVGVAKIEPEKGLLDIYSSSSGKVVIIATKENQAVLKDTLLLRLDNSIDMAQLKIQESKITGQNASIKSSEINAKVILSDLQNAQNDLWVNEQLFQSKAITEKVLNDSRTKSEKLQMEYEKQLADIERLKSGLKEIMANIEYQRTLLNEKNTYAAYDGQVLKWNVHPGDFITAGQKLGQFAPSGPLIAITEVDELFANRITTGLRAEIISQVNGNTIGEGEVLFVGGMLKKKSLFSDETTVEDRRVREVKIRLDDNSQVMINNRVDCVIYLN